MCRRSVLLKISLMISASRLSYRKVRKYIAGRTSDLAADIVLNGRRKISANDMKALVERLLMPLARMDAALSLPVCGGLQIRNDRKSLYMYLH